MQDRRAWLWLVGVSLLLAVGATAPAAQAATTRTRSDLNLVQYVNSFSGTDAGQPNFGTGGGAANTFPGADRPFGMAQWSPDTSPSTVNIGAGYSYGDSAIKGFSLTHISGAGCPIYQDIPFMPTTAPVTVSPAEPFSTTVNPAYTASFTHTDEEAAPGYYRVRLNPGTPGAINSELTTTTRTGFGRFTFPATTTASMIINTGGSAMAESSTAVQIDPANHEVTGSASSGGFCYQRDTYTVYFAAEFSQPFTAYGTWKKQLLLPGTTSNSDATPDAMSYPSPFPGPNSDGAQAGAYVTFDTTHNQVVKVRVGVSFVSVANARANLQAENNGSVGFDAVRADASAAWNSLLNQTQVSGGSLADTRTFYTMLYHVLLQPSVFSDANGQYMGFDNVVHTASYTDATGAAVPYTQYANYSGWDVYRSQIPLLALLAPRRTGDMVQSLLADAQQSGWLPKWSVANGHTDVMVGDPADPIIAGSYAFGATRFDTAAALQAMIKGATQYGQSSNAMYVERQALNEYQTLGYVPQEEDMGTMASFENPAFVWGAAATTLEYTTADFSIARFAGALGDTATYNSFMQRSANWQKVFNPATRYVEPRLASGAFAPNYDPTSETGFAEGDGAQYTWMIPYNLHGLFTALGGDMPARTRLDTFFTRLNDGPTSPYAFLGNEPTLEAPWEYDWLGQPYKTQGIVRHAMLGLYSAAPGGYPGNDDLGEMSSWYIFGALGLYPEIPGVGVLALGSPLFPHAVLRLAGGDVTIDAPNASDTTPYVRSLTLNGQPYVRPWLSMDALAGGARLVFDLGSSPNQSWGSGPGDAPPSFAPGDPYTPPGSGTGGPVTPTATPEPGSGVLYGSGLAALLAGLSVWRCRRGWRV